MFMDFGLLQVQFELSIHALVFLLQVDNLKFQRCYVLFLLSFLVRNLGGIFNTFWYLLLKILYSFFEVMSYLLDFKFQLLLKIHFAQIEAVYLFIGALSKTQEFLI